MPGDTGGTWPHAGEHRAARVVPDVVPCPGSAPPRWGLQTEGAAGATPPAPLPGQGSVLSPGSARGSPSWAGRGTGLRLPRPPVPGLGRCPLVVPGRWGQRVPCWGSATGWQGGGSFPVPQFLPPVIERGKGNTRARSGFWGACPGSGVPGSLYPVSPSRLCPPRECPLSPSLWVMGQEWVRTLDPACGRGMGVGAEIRLGGSKAPLCAEASGSWTKSRARCPTPRDRRVPHPLSPQGRAGGVCPGRKAVGRGVMPSLGSLA